MKKMLNDIISIVGTRPEILRVIKNLPSHLIVNTGQHYDENMDRIFWEEQGIEPDMNVCAQSFADIYDGVFRILKENKPKIVIIYGDTRSSFASALAAKDNDIRVAHLEAGVRGYDMRVPEERNRIMIDSISDYLLCINKKGKDNLLKENIQGEIFIVGDMLYDRYVQSREHDDYTLLTIHRKENQNKDLIKELIINCGDGKIIFPVHPAIEKFLDVSLFELKNLEIINPVGHNEMLKLIKNAKLVITDSGGVQREASFIGVPLVSVMNVNPMGDEINVFGNGHAEEKIRDILLQKCKEI